MDQAQSHVEELLRRAAGYLTDAGATDRDAISQAGAALEEAAGKLPPEIPHAGSVLSLTLELLQVAYEKPDPDPQTIDLAVQATLSVADRLGAGGREAAEEVRKAGVQLWATLERDPAMSPFEADLSDTPEPQPSEPAWPRDADGWSALLLGIGPDEREPLERVRAWLAELGHVDAAGALDALLEGDDADLDAAAQVALEALATVSAAGSEPAECPEQEEADEQPTCLEFAGDATLLAEFVAESLDHIQAAEAGMLAVEADPTDAEAIAAVFRAFHTIKGTAGFLGLAHLQELAHRAENLLDRVRRGEIQLTGGYADLALESSDLLKEMLQELEGWIDGPLPPPPAQFVELLAKLSAPDRAVTEDPLPDDAIARTGDILVNQGIIDRATVEHLAAESDGRPLGERIVASGAASVTDVAGALRKQRKAAQSVTDATVRVSTERLDALVNMVGELVIANAMLAQDEELHEGASQKVVRKIDQISKITRELQNVSMSLRMVPLSATFQKMARAVRDLSRKSGKKVEFVTEGDDTEIDRNMVEAIGDPLLHMVRNAVDHGIETPQERLVAGKPEVGRVSLRAYHAAGSVMIELQDDGRGLDRDRIYEKAVARGVIEEGTQISDEEVYRLIFHAGLSTAREVTDVSGRGVGMDVVRRNIEAMRGRVDISSTPGEGSTFTLRVPLTLAIIDGMLLRVGCEQYILPTISIIRSVRPEPSALSTIHGRGEMLQLQGRMIPILRLHRLFKVEDATNCVEDGLLVITEASGSPVALLVDELLGQQQIVIKSLGDRLGEVRGVSGAAILGDGRVGLILDPEGLHRLALESREALAA